MATFGIIVGAIVGIGGLVIAYWQLELARQAKQSSGNTSTETHRKWPGDSERKLGAGDVLKVGCLRYPPFVDYDLKRDGVRAWGLYPTILTTMAEEDGFRLEYIPLKWHEVVPSLSNGKVDLVMCVLRSSERRKYGAFVGTIFRVGVGGVARRGQTKIRSYADLSRDDVTIAVTKGEIGWSYAVGDLGLDRHPKLTVVEDASIQKMMGLVLSGEVDCALADALSCAQFISSNPVPPLEDVFSGRPIHVEDNALMLSAERTGLAQYLQARIQQVRTSAKVRGLEREIEAEYEDVLWR